MLAYAFGEGALEEALRQARACGVAERFRLARLLLAECRFNEGLSELIEISRGADNYAERALMLLIKHAEERSAISGRVALLPLTCGLDEYFAKGLKPDQAKLVPVLRTTFKHSLSPYDTTSMESEEIIIPPDAIIRDMDSYETICMPSTTELLSRKLVRDSWKTAYLETDSKDLLLLTDVKAPLYSSARQLKLHSAYCGPLRFRLYRFETEESWRTVSASALVAEKPVREWDVTFKPLRENNQAEKHNVDVDVKDVNQEGYYLVTFEARYAPMIAAAKFCVSHVALYVRAACNQAIIVAVDRRNGRPVANAPIALAVQGTPSVSSLLEGKPLPFQQGFRNESLTANETEAMENARQYLAGQTEAKLYPNIQQELDGVTDADGIAIFKLDIGRENYSYKLNATRLGPSFAKAQMYIPVRTKEQDAPRVVAWATQPVYRPGDEANLKGIYRRFNGLRVAAHDPQVKSAVDIELKNAKGSLCKSHCQLSSAGTFNFSFKIPSDAQLGIYNLFVDGQDVQPSSFLSVEEFRLPTFYVAGYLQHYYYAPGETCEGSVDVRYFTGKPAAGAEVEITLETGSENAPTVTSMTDDNGNVKFQLPLPIEKDEKYHLIRAVVMDASGQSFSTTMSFRCMSAPFQVTCDATPNPAIVGSSVRLTAIVKNWADLPIKDATVVAQGLDTAVQTDEKGLAIFDLKAAEKGADQKFNITVAFNQKAVHCVAYLRLQAAKPNAPSIVTSVNQPVHRDFISVHAHATQVGEDLKVELEVDRADGEDAFVLVSVEHLQLLTHRALRLKPGKHELAFKTDLSWTPHVYVHASLFTGTDCIKSESSAYIKPVHRFLTLEVVTDKEEYAPGERCLASIRATDFEGRPVPNVELSLGVVNEAIYALREDPTPDLQQYYHLFYLPHEVQDTYDYPAPYACSSLFWKGPRYAWGYLHPLTWNGSGHSSFGSRSGGGRRLMVKRHGGARADSEVRLRENFKNTAHWVAELITDATGIARTEFQFPDDITNWRFIARGVTADTLIGEVRRNHRTFLPMQIELALPRALRSGDHVQAKVVLHNNGNRERAIQVSRSIDQAEPMRSKISVAARKDTSVDLDIQTSSPGTLKIEAKAEALDGGAEDAIARTLAVWPHGYPVARRFVGTLSEAATIPLDLGGQAQSGSLQVELNIEPGFAGSVESALDQLIGYPYGCVEQTMSRFMPAVVASRALKAANLNARRAGELPKIVQQGLTRLVNFQHADGGWGWWEKDATNVFMTAYVLEGLSLCRNAGHTVPQTVLERAERCLFDRVLEGKNESRTVYSIGAADIRCYAARALALYYAANAESFRVQLERLGALLDVALADSKLQSRDFALAADTLRIIGRRQQADVLLEKARAELGGLTKDRNSILAASSILEVGAALSPGRAEWVKLGHELVLKRQGAGWSDTLTTAAAVRGLSALISPGRGAMQTDVCVDGQVIQTVNLAENERAALVKFGPELLQAKAISLRPKQSNANFYWSARVSGFLLEPPTSPENPAATLVCRLFVPGQDAHEIQPDEKGQVVVTRGRTIRVRLECQLTTPLSYLRISFPRPCGVELVQPPKLKDGLVAMEDHDNGFHFFADSWTAGRHVIEFGVRAECAGVVFAPPPELEPMYESSVPTRIDAPKQWRIVPSRYE
ncbi:MAG: alpha-2-macroglobulin family protein [Planctomycetota bacterium]